MLEPMFALVMLSFLIMVVTFRSRMSAVRAGKLPLSYFALMQGDEAPELVAKSTRNFSNLFEVPVLFYVGALAYLVLGIGEATPILCAWLFVVARALHSIIHLTYNNVLHRLIIFGAGNLCVLVMWIAIMQAAR
ncbi:MAG: MAPEG family protein [Pseudohongiellaceae bacterium]